MIRLAFGLLLASLALSGCGEVPAARPRSIGSGSTAPPGPVGHVAILVPLSGAYAERAQALVNAAKLALGEPGSPTLNVRDTSGTPAGAAAAAAAAIAAGDRLIIGPLTSGETAAVAGPAQTAGVPVLAFTTDVGQSRPGVWILGITPLQQATRLVSYATAQGKNRFAAILPRTDFGGAMAAALTKAAASTSAPAPSIYRYDTTVSGMSAAVREASGFDQRRGAMDAEVRAAKARHDEEGRQLAAELSQRDVPPPPFDSLLLSETGDRLATLTSLLRPFDINPSEVRLMGPALWSAAPARAGASLGRAWFAAPDTQAAARTAFDEKYTATYGTPATGIADLAYDAASIARVLAHDRGYGLASLTRPEGFAGVDGVLALRQDGSVLRGLALFELQDGNPVIIDAAPAVISVTGS